MSAMLHFHVAHVDSLFSIVGSADRDLLLEIGVTLGTEFRAPSDEEEDEYYADEEAEEPFEWDSGEDEADSAREILVKMIMTEIPPDLSENEAYAIQDYFAAYAQRSDQVHALEPDDLQGEISENWDAEVAAHVRDVLLSGVEEDDVIAFLEWLRDRETSPELLARIETLVFGRLPDADEPTFTDLEDEAYAARFGYLLATEAERVEEEMAQLAPESAPDHGALGYLLAALLHYCASHARDLVVTLDE